ncbi:MAG TPA: hypothetical protein GYA08_21835 [Chloroflexi bacterium]|nr:hypothetical protein [Chloroflexota bacterium]
MGFFAKILAAFTGKAPTGGDRYLPLYVLDHRCREPISGQIDLLNELSLAEEGGYYVRKVLHTAGKRRCFSQVEVQLWLDGKKQITRHEVQGGRWLTAAEYAAAVERQAQEAEAAVNNAGDLDEAP